MNVNYIGSLAERNFRFSSTVSVTAVEDSDLFNGISIYVPRKFSEDNIVGFDASVVTKDLPAIMSVTVDNYADELKGDLLDQVRDIFRDDTNVDVTLFLIIFYDIDTATTMWEYGTKSIAFAPLTRAFKALYTISYIKMLFDPYRNGEDVTIAGRAATAVLSFANGGAASVTLAAGTYTFNDGTMTWSFTIDEAVTIGAGESYADVDAAATTVGLAALTEGHTIAYSETTPALDDDLTITVDEFTQGRVASTSVSTYFDFLLCMAYLCKSNIKLSALFASVMIDYDKIDLDTLEDTNKCYIRSKTAAEEAEVMTSLATKDRAKYLWGALYLMQATNTAIIVDCENRDPWIQAFKEWFASKNSSGEYVGNKLHLIRLTSQKCLGPVSSLNSLYNAGDSDGYDLLDAKSVSYFQPISATNSGDSALSKSRGVTGFPMNALMISKFADYTSGQNTADLITDKGTLTSPVLTNDEAYKKIQSIVIGNIAKFSGTGRITSIVANFPSFADAKVGLTALEASSSWTAKYVDDLDEVTISGGITAE